MVILQSLSQIFGTCLENTYTNKRNKQMPPKGSKINGNLMWVKWKTKTSSKENWASTKIEGWPWTETLEATKQKPKEDQNI